MRCSYFKNNVLPLWRLALPLVLTGLSQALVPFFETLFLARLGADSLAAGAIVSWIRTIDTILDYHSKSVAHRLVWRIAQLERYQVSIIIYLNWFLGDSFADGLWPGSHDIIRDDGFLVGNVTHRRKSKDKVYLEENINE